MRTIETVVNVGVDRKLTVQLPSDIPTGTHAVVVVIDEIPKPRRAFSMKDFPAHDVGPWPEGFTVRREEIYGDDGR
jgi:hypothetical protein